MRGVCSSFSILINLFPQDHLITPSEEFHDTYINLEGHKWAKFKVERGHSKLYVPEQLLLTEAEYIKQNQLKTSEQEKIAKELEISVSHLTAGELEGVNIEEQHQCLKEAKAEHDKKLKEKKKHNGGFSQGEEELSTGARSSSPPGKQVDLSALSPKELEEQRAQLKQFEQENEKKKRQTNQAHVARSNQVPHTATATRGAMAIQHPRSEHVPDHPEHMNNHQHHNPHARQGHYDLGGLDRAQRHCGQQNLTGYDVNSQPKLSNDRLCDVATYHHPGPGTEQYPPVGTSQPPPLSSNLAVKPSYGNIPPASSTDLPYHHCPPGMQHTSDDHQHNERPTPPLPRTAIDKQHQLVEQPPSMPTMDTVVVVRNAEFHNPVTGTVKFIGHVQGFDELVVGLELVSCTYYTHNRCTHNYFLPMYIVG